MHTLEPNLKLFNNLPEFPYLANYTSYQGLNMHYLDEGKGEIILALHGEPTWSYLYRKFIPVLAPYFRFIAPDFIGFGKSDKIVGQQHYRFSLHYHTLENFIFQLGLKDITLVVQDWGGLLGLSLLGSYPDLFKRVVIMNTFLPVGDSLPLTFKIWRTLAKWHPTFPVGTIMKAGCHRPLHKDVVNAYKAPFPNSKYKDGAKAFPKLVPSHPDDEGVSKIKRARETLSGWNKPALIMFSNKDLIMSRYRKFFCELMPAVAPERRICIEHAGHFLQEDQGEVVAAHIKDFIFDTLTFQ